MVIHKTTIIAERRILRTPNWHDEIYPKANTGRKILEGNAFTTLITECEAVVNSRPLAYAESSIEDCSVIRFIDFLLLFANVSPPTSIDQYFYNDDDSFYAS